ncbi:MAG: hypothetical protein KAT70_05120, partial [Thermoplasmata archaeon]|nr:hypothetical protein [Thermoplasmata archaeon]
EGSDVNYLTEMEFSGGLYLQDCKEEADVYGSGRAIAIWGYEPRINESGIEVSRREAPETFDFFGWYNYLKNPLESEVEYDPYDGLYYYSTGVVNIEHMPPRGYMIYENGMIHVWYNR